MWKVSSCPQFLNAVSLLERCHKSWHFGNVSHESRGNVWRVKTRGKNRHSLHSMEDKPWGRGMKWMYLPRSFGKGFVLVLSAVRERVTCTTVQRDRVREIHSKIDELSAEWCFASVNKQLFGGRQAAFNEEQGIWGVSELPLRWIVLFCNNKMVKLIETYIDSLTDRAIIGAVWFIFFLSFFCAKGIFVLFTQLLEEIALLRRYSGTLISSFH